MIFYNILYRKLNTRNFLSNRSHLSTSGFQIVVPVCFFSPLRARRQSSPEIDCLVYMWCNEHVDGP
jgi:hypothetical protein